MADKPLEEQEVAAALGVSVDTLRRLIESKEFPDGFYVTERTKVWGQEDVRSYLHLRGRIGGWPARKAEKPEPAQKQSRGKNESCATQEGGTGGA